MRARDDPLGRVTAVAAFAPRIAGRLWEATIAAGSAAAKTTPAITKTMRRRSRTR
jgi:hypothetical protein